MEDIVNFLTANDFKKIDENSYANSLCNVVIEKDHYAVANNNGDVMYSRDYNIYWLIGVLTYYGFISKNYIQLTHPNK